MAKREGKKKIKRTSKQKKSKSVVLKQADVNQLNDIANLLRRDSISLTTSAGSGHPSSCLSCAEIISVLYFSEMRYDSLNPNNSNNDEFILSKGHAAPILYSAMKRAGLLKESLSNFRKSKGHIEGHPIPSKEEPWIKYATGSLGQGLSIGLGVAMAQKLQGTKARTFVLLGDSEVAEGSIYEACELASHYKTKNLVAILDMNRLGQSGQTLLGWNAQAHKNRFSSFGWNVHICDGHSIIDLLNAFKLSRESKSPFLIIAKTIKGKGVSFIENQDGWHGKALSEEQRDLAFKEIPAPEFPNVIVKLPLKPKAIKGKLIKHFPTLDLNEEISTREAYGRALENLIEKDDKIIAIDAEVSNSTFSEILKRFHPDHFIEAYIAEQNMIGMALGLSIKGYHVFASTFSSFLTRAHDQLRMACYSKGNITVCGSHAGISIGQDGASQMGLDDISMFRDLPGSMILYPSDAISTEALVKLCDQNNGIKYLRTTRSKTPVIYNKNDKFPLGDFKILKESQKDSVVLIGAGITLHECLKAHQSLLTHKIHSAVIDLYCLKPLDFSKLISFIHNHGCRVIVVEDHYSSGGIGEMLANEFLNSGIRMKSLSVTKIPHSGTPNELLEKHGLNSRHIVMHARTFI